MGKSAVTDIIGLLGNSHNQMSRSVSGGKAEELFSFLNKEKFLKSGCAANFQGSLRWYEGEPDRKYLNAQAAMHLPKKVEYLPQKYLERICANIADDEFRATLNEVIFRYVEAQNRYGTTNLDDLIKYLTQQEEEDIAQKKQELHQTNEKIVSIEKKLTEDYRKELEEKIKLKKEELEAHASVRPAEKQNPEITAGSGAVETAEIEQLTQNITGLAYQITQIQNERIEVSRTIEDLRQIRQSIQQAAEKLISLKGKYQTALNASGLSFDQIVKVTTDYSALDEIVSSKDQRLREIEALLITKDQITAMMASDDDSTIITEQAKSLVCQKEALENQKTEVIERLGKPAREYQEYLRGLKSWTDKETELRGNDLNPAADTLKGLATQQETPRLCRGGSRCLT